jgi:hypothetical protein
MNQVSKFELGRLVATRGAVCDIPGDEMMKALRRHASGDWGEVGTEDWEANEESLREGARLLSVYSTSAGVKFWIITEADRSATTVLLPDEY